MIWSNQVTPLWMKFSAAEHRCDTARILTRSPVKSTLEPLAH